MTRKNEIWKMVLLSMQLTCPTRIAGRRHAKQRVSPRGEPAIEDGSQFREGPQRHNVRQPSPPRQHANHFNPGKVAFTPTAIAGVSVHLVRHFIARAGRRALQNFRIVVIQPLDSLIAIERFDMRPHPATEVAMAIGVDFDFVHLAR